MDKALGAKPSKHCQQTNLTRRGCKWSYCEEGGGAIMGIKYRPQALGVGGGSHLTRMCSYGIIGGLFGIASLKENTG